MYHIDWQQYYMSLAEHIALRSNCLRRKVGAIIIKNDKIASTGYNHSPKFCKTCNEDGCIRENQKIPSGEHHELCRAIHAEQVALLDCDLDLKGTTMFVTTQPCSMCARMIVYEGISNVVYQGVYNDSLARLILHEGGVRLYQYKPEEMEVKE